MNARINIDEVRDLSKDLPKPLSGWIQNNALISIYRAKNIFKPLWNDQELRRLTELARVESNLYERPVYDEYDEKSAIYLARARYYQKPSRGSSEIVIEEWLSVRLVPGLGEPSGAGELEMFYNGNESTEQLMQKHLYAGNRNFMQFVAASNRMCAIRPYFLAEHKTKLMPRKLQFSAMLYGLINWHFVHDYLGGGKYHYITGVILDNIVRNSLEIMFDGKIYGTCFISADKTLALDTKELRINRYARGHYAYKFPAYFLNFNELVSLLKRLSDQGKISEATLKHYLQYDREFEEITEDFKSSLFTFRHAGSLFGATGRLYASQLTGEELRMIADQEVSDGPKLRITPIHKLEKSIDELFIAGRTQRFF